MISKFALAVLALPVALVAAPATAANIVPVSAVPSSSYPGYEALFSIDASKTTDWASYGQGVNSTIWFDLGGLYLLNGVNLFDRTTSGSSNGSFVGGVTDFTTGFTLTYYDAMHTAIGMQSFSKSTPTPPTQLSDFEFTGSVNSGAVKVASVLYSVTAANGPNPGLADINFTGSVPEPATWTMMLMGFGMIGAGLRSRRRPAVRVTYA